MTTTAETPQTISRAEAKAQGLKFYYTGEACKRGHIAKRNLNGTCTQCASAYKLAHTRNARAKDPEGFRATVSAAVRRHYERNRGSILDKKRTYYLANQEKLKAAAKARRAAKKAEKAQAAQTAP
jgi:hypothetical protein